MAGFSKQYHFDYRYKSGQQRGFGLTECMISAFILMTGALAIYQATRLWHHKTGHLAMISNLHELNGKLETHLQPAFYHSSAQQQAALLASPVETGNMLVNPLNAEINTFMVTLTQSISVSVQALNSETVSTTDTVQLSTIPSHSAVDPDLVVYEMHISQSAHQQSLDSIIAVSVFMPDGLAYPDTFRFNSDY